MMSKKDEDKVLNLNDYKFVKNANKFMDQLLEDEQDDQPEVGIFSVLSGSDYCLVGCHVKISPLVLQEKPPKCRINYITT